MDGLVMSLPGPDRDEITAYLAAHPAWTQRPPSFGQSAKFDIWQRRYRTLVNNGIGHATVRVPAAGDVFPDDAELLAEAAHEVARIELGLRRQDFHTAVAMIVDLHRGLIIAREIVEEWAGCKLTDEQTARLAEAVPWSSIPEAVSTIVHESMRAPYPDADDTEAGALVMTDYIRVKHQTGGGELNNEPYALALPVPDDIKYLDLSRLCHEAIAAWLSRGGTIEVPTTRRSSFAIELIHIAWDSRGLDRWDTPAALRLLGEHDPHEDCGANGQFPRCSTFAWLCKTWELLENAGDVDMHGGSEWRHAVAHLAWTVSSAAENDQQLISALTAAQAKLAGKFARPQTVSGVICSKIAWSTVDRQAAGRVADECAAAVMALPLAERAPEVADLFTKVTAIMSTGRQWTRGGGSELFTVLVDWFTANGYQADGPQPSHGGTS